MIPTDGLIDALVNDAAPVRRLRAPLWRWLTWFGVASVVSAFLLVLHGVRPDLRECVTEAYFLTGVVAAAITALLAAAGVLIGSLPDRSRAWLLLPVPAAMIWIVGSGGGCLLDWIATDFSAMTSGTILECLWILLWVSLPLTVVQFILLRPILRVMPSGTIAVASLATAAMAVAVLNLAHAHESSALVLIWNLGAAIVIWGLGVLGTRAARSAILA